MFIALLSCHYFISFIFRISVIQLDSVNFNQHPVCLSAIEYLFRTSYNDALQRRFGNRIIIIGYMTLVVTIFSETILMSVSGLRLQQ